MWRRRRQIPQVVRSAVPERLLCAAEVDGGAWLALTGTEICLVDDGALVWRRPWHEVERGEWDGEGHALTVHWVGVDAAETFTTVEESPRDLPLVFRERVDASVVVSQTEPAPGGGTLRAAVRRAPDGSLLSQVFAVGRVRPGPDLDTQVDALEQSVRREAGL